MNSKERPSPYVGLVNEAIVSAKVFLLCMPVRGFMLRSYQNQTKQRMIQMFIFTINKYGNSGLMPAPVAERSMV